MGSPFLAPIKHVDVSNPQRTRTSIQILLAQGDEPIVFYWLNTLAQAAPLDMVKYVWTQSVRCNQTRLLFPWLAQRYPQELAQWNATMDAVKMLTSPRSWPALKKEGLVPTLAPEEIGQTVVTWNKAIETMSSNFQASKQKERYRTLFQEWSNIQIDFIEHYSPSYRLSTKMLDMGLHKNHYQVEAMRIPRRSDTGSLLLARANAMAASSNPDMWALACLERGNLALSCGLSHSPRLSTWWHDLLQERYPQEFKQNAWQEHLSKTSPKERPVPDNIVIAHHMTAGAFGIKERLSSMLTMVDRLPPTQLEQMDLGSIGLDLD